MQFLKGSLPLFLLAFTLGNCGAPSGGGCSAGAPFVSSERFLGNQAPNFVLPNLAGEKVELAKLVQEKPTLLVFWATWCPTCIEEIPVLNEWVERYPNLQILGINVQESIEEVKPFAAQRGLRYPVLLDEEAEVTHQYGLVGIPAAILLAKGGRVIYYGFALPPDIEKVIGS